jgi:hypothetical protein
MIRKCRVAIISLRTKVVKQIKRDKGCSMCMKGKKDNQKVSFSKLDNNSDGRISISEYLDNPNQEFDSTRL